jgi:hypothetical protein
MLDTLKLSVVPTRTRLVGLGAAVLIALPASACGSDAVPATADTTADSLPFATDEALTETVDDEFLEDADRATDDELYGDDEEAAPILDPENPLSADETEALLAAVPDDDLPDAAVNLGASVVDPTHNGVQGVTAQHLMRELTLAYDGLGELLTEPERTANGGSFTFSLTDVTIDGADSFRVDVKFTYVNDPDEPAMIVAHQAEKVTLTPYDLNA